MRRSGHVLTATILLTLISVFILGCDHDSVTPNCPDYGVGAIKGFVRGGGTPVRAQLRAIPIGGYDDTRFRARTDSTGWYQMELPCGTYRLSLLPPDYSEGGSFTYSGMDTVKVIRWARRLDLSEGSLRVHATVPGFLEGRTVGCMLNGHTADRDRDATVRESSLEWTFPLVHVGRFEIVLEFGGTTLRLPRLLDPHGAGSISVGPDAPTVYEVNLSTLSELSGSVHGSWESIHAGSPRIWAFGTDSVLVGGADAGSDGRFVLDVFPPQPVRIMVGDVWSSTPLWAGGDSYESATVYDLHAGERREGVEILESGILCHIDWPDPGTASSATLVLVDSRGRLTSPYGWSSSGRIGITDLSPGRYFLRIEHACGVPWVPMWYDGSATLANATPIEITTLGETVEITIHLVEGGRIEGAILPSLGGTQADHDILLFDAAGKSLCEDWSDESSGAFSFQGLDDGAYRVAVRQSSNRRWWYPGSANPDSAGMITVAGHGAVSGIEWRMP